MKLKYGNYWTLKFVIENCDWKLKLYIEIENKNWKLKIEIEIEIKNWILNQKI